MLKCIEIGSWRRVPWIKWINIPYGWLGMVVHCLNNRHLNWTLFLPDLFHAQVWVNMRSFIMYLSHIWFLLYIAEGFMRTSIWCAFTQVSYVTQSMFCLHFAIFATTKDVWSFLWAWAAFTVTRNKKSWQREWQIESLIKGYRLPRAHVREEKCRLQF